MPTYRIINIQIAGMAPNGCGVGIYDNPAIQVRKREVLVWGAFPGEEVEVQIFKHDGGKWFGVPVNILTTPLVRETPKDSVYLSSSPWQGIGLQDELKFKMEIIKQVFEKNQDVLRLIENISGSENGIVHDSKVYGYRNKMEYHIYEEDQQDDNGDAGDKNDVACEAGITSRIIPTIFGRQEKRRVPIPTNSLVVPGLHEFVEACVRDLGSTFSVGRNLKTLIIRSVDNIGVALFVKDLDLALIIGNVLHDPSAGTEVEKAFSEKYKDTLTVYFSKPEGPASTPDICMYQPKQPALFAKLGDLRFEFGLMSFFQINIGMAEKLLTYMSDRISEYILRELFDKDKGLDIQRVQILDFYSGVGTIGLFCLQALQKNSTVTAQQFSRIKLLLVEDNKEASEYAKINTESLGLSGQTEIICGDALASSEQVAGSDIMIVDPPRSGLHPRLLQTIKSSGPKLLIYQSCNIETQARDILGLSEVYVVEDVSFYNFFPRTPHIESLIFLKRSV